MSGWEKCNLKIIYKHFIFKSGGEHLSHGHWLMGKKASGFLQYPVGRQTGIGLDCFTATSLLISTYQKADEAGSKTH